MLFLRILRRIGLGLALFVFSLLLQVAIFFVPISRQLQDQDRVTSWFVTGGAYDRFASLVAEQVASAKDQENKVAIEPTELEQVINEALPPDALAGYGQQIIGGFYAWLWGETPQPEFHIDLTDRQQAIEVSFRQLIIERLQDAPVCSAEPADGNYDPFEENCVPPGETPKSVAKIAAHKLFDNDGPLSDLTIDSDKVFKEDMSDNPAIQAYARIDGLRWALILTVMITGGLAVLLASTWRRGLKRISIIVLTTSLLASVGTVALTHILPGLIDRNVVKTADTDINITGLIIPVLKVTVHDIGQAILFISVPLLVLSIGCLLWLWRSGRTPETQTPTQPLEPSKTETKTKSKTTPTDQVQ